MRYKWLEEKWQSTAAFLAYLAHLHATVVHFIPVLHSDLIIQKKVYTTDLASANKSKCFFLPFEIQHKPKRQI